MGAWTITCILYNLFRCDISSRVKCIELKNARHLLFFCSNWHCILQCNSWRATSTFLWCWSAIRSSNLRPRNRSFLCHIPWEKWWINLVHTLTTKGIPKNICIESLMFRFCVSILCVCVWYVPNYLFIKFVLFILNVTSKMKSSCHLMNWNEMQAYLQITYEPNPSFSLIKTQLTSAENKCVVNSVKQESNVCWFKCHWYLLQYFLLFCILKKLILYLLNYY